MNPREEAHQEWQRDIRIADNTHPNSFANGPLIRSLFKVSENMDVAGQFLNRLNDSTTRINNSFNKLKDVIEKSNENSKKLSEKVFWLNVILALATIVGAIATTILATPVVIEFFKK